MISNTIDQIWITLFKWFSINKRTFPWRETNNPYHILVAEFLLQQTHVRKVEEVYQNFLLHIPNIETLANSSLNNIENIIKPIGLTYRASRLKKCAEILCSTYNGHIPSNYKMLIDLPGIGDYIANAVLCYAFGQPTVPIDTNVVRFFSRVHGMVSNKKRPRTDQKLANEIRSYYKFDNTKTANLAVLDFAGLICTDKKPQCAKCPLSTLCCSYNYAFTVQSDQLVAENLDSNQKYTHSKNRY